MRGATESRVRGVLDDCAASLAKAPRALTKARLAGLEERQNPLEDERMMVSLSYR